ncbi:MAG: PEP-CTERM sorting domain-containing protein [Acidobacteriaceae bacterium]
MKLRAILLCLTVVTFLGASSFASSYGPRSSAAPLSGRTGGVIHTPKPGDSTLYSNGGDDGIVGYTINFGYDVSNSFNLAANSTLNTATFSNWLFPGDTATSVNWAITTQLGGGTTLFSGTGAITQVFVGTNSFGYNVYNDTFSLGGVSLAAGTYYLDLSGLNVPSGDPGYWGESAGPSVACQSGNSLPPCTSIPSESFSIAGTAGGGPPPIPEPSSILLFGTGLLGAAGALRRKFSM